MFGVLVAPVLQLLRRPYHRGISITRATRSLSQSHGHLHALPVSNDNRVEKKMGETANRSVPVWSCSGSLGRSILVQKEIEIIQKLQRSRSPLWD